jgi:plasmid segregation protein ParM
MGETNPTENVYLVGIDIGFGDVKVVATGPNGKGDLKTEHLKFPTAIAKARRHRIRGLKNAFKQYGFNNQKYLVGNEALFSERVISSKEISFLLEYAPLFVFKIMEELSVIFNKSRSQMLQAPKKLCIGLPLAYYFSKKKELTNKIRKFNVSDTAVDFEDTEIDVLPQGQGIQFDFLISNGTISGIWKEKTYLVLDIGYNTVDVLAVSEGSADPQISDMTRGAGVCRICKDLKKELKAKDIELSDPLVKKALIEKKVFYCGEAIRLEEIIGELAADYAESLFYDLTADFGEFLSKTEKLIIAGGGAYYVREYFVEKYKSKFIHVPGKAEFSNARGCMKFLEIE